MNSLQSAFSHDHYVFRRKVLRFFGGEFNIYDADGNLVMYSEQKAFKLKEDIHIYTEKQMSNEVLNIRARQRIDFGATYDVIDAPSGERIGALRRKGLKSMLRDEWLFLDSQDQEIGTIKEDNVAMALIRRAGLSWLLPQRYTISVQGQCVASLKQHFNPFVLKYILDLSNDHEKRLDTRLAVAGGILFCAIERRQS